MKNLPELLYMLRAISVLMQHLHWKYSERYGDHLLFERLYNDIQEEIDAVAEKTVGILGQDSVSLQEDANYINDTLKKFDESVAGALEAEKALLKMISDLMSDDTTDGIENLLQGIADKHEGHIYLLQQRLKKRANIINKLCNVSNVLDQKGLYNLANRLDRIIKLSILNWQYYGFKSPEDYENFKRLKGLVTREEKSELEVSEKVVEPETTSVENKSLIKDKIMLTINEVMRWSRTNMNSKDLYEVSKTGYETATVKEAVLKIYGVEIGDINGFMRDLERLGFYIAIKGTVLTEARMEIGDVQEEVSLVVAYNNKFNNVWITIESKKDYEDLIRELLQSLDLA